MKVFVVLPCFNDSSPICFGAFASKANAEAYASTILEAEVVESDFTQSMRPWNPKDRQASTVRLPRSSGLDQEAPGQLTSYISFFDVDGSPIPGRLEFDVPEMVGDVCSETIIWFRHGDYTFYGFDGMTLELDQSTCVIRNGMANLSFKGVGPQHRYVEAYISIGGTKFPLALSLRGPLANYTL